MNYVNITLDKERHIRFDYNAIADMEEYMGKGVGELFSSNNMGLSVIRALLFFGLKWEDHKLTKDKVGKLIGEYMKDNGEDSLDTLMDSVTKALEVSGLFKFEETDEKN